MVPTYAWIPGLTSSNRLRCISQMNLSFSKSIFWSCIFIPIESKLGHVLRILRIGPLKRSLSVMNALRDHHWEQTRILGKPIRSWASTAHQGDLVSRKNEHTAPLRTAEWAEEPLARSAGQLQNWHPSWTFGCLPALGRSDGSIVSHCKHHMHSHILFLTLLSAWVMATQGLLSAPSLIWFTSQCVSLPLTIFAKIFTDRLYPIPKLLLSKHLAWQSYGAGSCNDILTASFKMGIFLSLSSTLSLAPGIYQIPNKLFTGIKGRCVF